MTTETEILIIIANDQKIFNSLFECLNLQIRHMYSNMCAEETIIPSISVLFLFEYFLPIIDFVQTIQAVYM